MIVEENIFNDIVELWRHLTLKRRNQFKLLLVLMIIAAFAEVVTIGAILPFLGVIATPETLFNHPYVQPINNFLQIDSVDSLRVVISIAFISIALIAGAIRILLLFLSTKHLFAAGIDISTKIYRRTLYQPYSVHVQRNSSDVINIVLNKCSDVVFGIMMPIVTLITSIILLIGIIGVLILIDPLVMMVTFLTFGLIYTAILRYTSHNVKLNSKLIAEESTKAIQCLQEGIGGIRDVLISNAQTHYFSIYNEAISKMRIAQGNNSIIAATPRFIIETIGIVLIAALALYMIDRDGGVVTAIPILGALAIGAQRLLPALQQSYSAVTTIKGVEFALKDVLHLLNQPILEISQSKKIPEMIFEKTISLEKVSFKYTPESKYSLSNIDLTINQGDCVGIIGTTGGGKSTLLDIIMGLLSPTSGLIKIDGQLLDQYNIDPWQGCIAHVPQTIYLPDATIEQTIAFACKKDEIEYDRVIEAATIAQIDQDIQNFPGQYQARVGENGVLLSGGQRQRLGIARALYRQASVIIFDEATSALDAKTEQAVMSAINNLNESKTIFMVAHRVSTLSSCDKIIKIENGAIHNIGTYDDLLK
tara:strand:- start:266 stop:2035 length:1770 start_codon:yes stop_codon:yes gene_type:complete